MMPLTGATPAKNTANAAGALRNALTACNTFTRHETFQQGGVDFGEKRPTYAINTK